MAREVHLCRAPNGHELSVDCWCEPSVINLDTHSHPEGILVVRHKDEESLNLHRAGMLFARDQAQDWITQCLNDLNEL